MNEHRLIDWRAAAVFVLIVLVAGFALTKLFHLGFWLVTAVVAVALLLVGWTAIHEDVRPGGLANPRVDKKKD